MSRRKGIPSWAAPALVALLLALAPGALAQEDDDQAGREDARPNTTNTEEGNPGFDPGPTEEEPEDAVDTWFESPAGILVALVLAVVILGLVVAMTVRR